MKYRGGEADCVGEQCILFTVRELYFRRGRDPRQLGRIGNLTCFQDRYFGVRQAF